jgi:hypothetical protein
MTMLLGRPAPSDAEHCEWRPVQAPRSFAEQNRSGWKRL